ncbi:hypothetical protein [Desulfoluna butyratoxydans]|uniref:Nucleophile aminohydrolases n-terminal n=1 Tax=Desulfoluna butyratoxydans TaxID=231438 RepID=A0A4U8YL18_9BACT|nr:hypothetical protein [Desulfoluna butyratoxydans]VFQ44606.1 hypothetical protein MSL71_22550 [Desulfoluna butyratoxydans]
MCTIGTVFDASVVRSFKQCDLTDPTTFYPPEERQGKAGTYLALTRLGRPGLWAGGNTSGVTFTAADNYTRELTARESNSPFRLVRTNTYQGSNSSVDSLFLAYEKAVADYDNAQDAANSLADFYLNGDAEHPGPFESADIAMFSDTSQAVYMEYSPIGNFKFNGLGDVVGQTGKPEVLTLSPKADYFANTNNCRLFNTSVTYPMNQSTFLRLERAERLLLLQPNHDGVHKLLRDQYFGETELSICRVAVKPGEFYTQASVIFSTQENGLMCEYVINGNPRTKPWQTMTITK